MFGIVDVFYEGKHIEEKARSNHLHTYPSLSFHVPVTPIIIEDSMTWEKLVLYNHRKVAKD